MKSGGIIMGKNLSATMCIDCGEGLCYYGAKICSDCEVKFAEQEYEMDLEQYLLEKTEGIIPSDMEFIDWLKVRGENERKNTEKN